MKKLLLLALIVLMSTTLLAAGSNDHFNRHRANHTCHVSIVDMPYQEVDETESADLVFMREEEKLARDVYRAMDDQWGLRVFRNIAGSEQQHMNALRSLLDKYGILDPVGDDQPGLFSNPTLQGLYDQLVAQGNASIIDALIVGATIEDLDIHDLQGALDRTDNEDISTVYQNLMKGSRNHLRSFVGLLEENDEFYEAQYIDLDEFEEIISSPREHGPVDADGEPIAGCSRSGRRHHRNW